MGNNASLFFGWPLYQNSSHPIHAVLRILNSGVGTYNRQFTSHAPLPHTNTRIFWYTIYIHKEWTFSEAILSVQDQGVMHKLVEVCPESVLHIQSCKFHYPWWVLSLVANYCSLSCRLFATYVIKMLGCFRLRFTTICLWSVYIPKRGYNYSDGSYCVPVTQLYKHCVCDQETQHCEWRTNERAECSGFSHRLPFIFTSRATRAQGGINQN